MRYSTLVRIPLVRRLDAFLRRIPRFFSNVSPYEWSLGIAVAAYSIVFSIYLIQKFEFFRTGYFDFGGLIQQSWLVSHGHITSYALGRPINLIVAALYWIVPSPETLLVFQSIMLAIGAVPLYALALRELARRWYAITFAFLYLTSAFLWGINQYEYHDMAMVVPLFIFAIYFYSTNNILGYLVSFLLALFSSQLVVVIGLFMSLSYALDYRDSRSRTKLRFAILTLGFSALWAVYLQASILLPYYTFATFPPTGYTFTGSTQLLNPANILTNPGGSISYASADKFRYIVYLFSSVLFLPLLSLRRLLPAFPWLGVVASYSPALAAGGLGPVYQLYSNWGSFVLPFVLTSAIYGLKRFTTGSKDPEADRRRLGQTLCIMMLVSLGISMSTGAFSPISTPVNLSGGDSTVPTYVNPLVSYHEIWPSPVTNNTVLDSFVAMVPSKDSILTQNVIGSKLAQRLAPVYIFYQPGYKDVQADALLIDSHVDGLCTTCVNNILSSGNYTLFASYNEGGIYLYLKNQPPA